MEMPLYEIDGFSRQCLLDAVDLALGEWGRGSAADRAEQQTRVSTLRELRERLEIDHARVLVGSDAAWRLGKML